MRLTQTLLLTALAAFAMPAMAQQISPMTGTTNAPPTLPPATTTAPAATPGAAPGATPARPARPARQTLQQRFEAANTTHDGKLTLDQAKAGKMTNVVRHFDAIDTGRKGYVTLDDIHAHNRAQRAAHKAAKP